MVIMDSVDMHTAVPLGEAFFARDTVTVAREVLGKVLASTVGGELVAGRIVECEAYLGSDDLGSHAATRGITKRNCVMYGPPGRAYVYFTYGNHYMLNLVTEPEGVAGAVLVRALEPLLGQEVMASRRGRVAPECTNGPGKVAAALGVTLAENGSILGSGPLALYDAPAPPEPILTSGRIGLRAGHEALLRFYLQGNEYVSRGRPGPRKPTRRVGHERKAGR